jgi:hypothetical protein
MQGLLKRDDVLLLNNSRVGDLVDRIYPIELEIKDDTDAYRSASYLDIGSEGRLRTKLYDKRYYLNIPIVNFPFICSNILAASAYSIYLSVDTIFQRLWFLSGFPWQRVADNKDATESRVPLS